MRRSEFKVGNLLNDKNALVNYIYKDRAKIGVVVGMRGKDRDNPLVGWCLFDEVSNNACNIITKKLDSIDSYQNVIEDIEEVIANETDEAKRANAINAFNEIKKLIVVTTSTNVSDAEVYKTVEKAILRANPYRDNFFVSPNPAYGQTGSSLKPYRNNHLNYINTETGGRIYNAEIISIVRKATRAMEWRCYRYYKDITVNTEATEAKTTTETAEASVN